MTLYFVSYSFSSYEGTGFGNAHLRHKSIESIADINALADAVKALIPHYTQVVILYWQPFEINNDSSNSTAS
jgi:hypothetical protein